MKETLGLTRKAPDEFRVVSRPPLSVPPDFNLRPPAPGEEGAAAAAPTRDQAAGLVLGDGAATATTPDTAVTPVTATPTRPAADATFLNAAGVSAKDDKIRDTLNQEQTEAVQKEEEETWLDKWLPSKDASKKDPAVDAKGEAERIRTNKDSGKPVTEGETPVVKKKTSVLQRWMGGE